MSIKGYPIEGRREDISNQNDHTEEQKYATLPPAGVNRRALDTLSGGFYEVSAGVVVEAGSTSQTLNITGHTAKKGDLIRIMTSANGIEEYEMFVKNILSANSFELFGATSAIFAAGDTIDIYRFVSPRYNSDGSSMSSVTNPPVQFILDSVTTTVTEDTITPSNNAPLPVKVTSATGPINITAGDLHVQTSHAGATYDSMRIGDGTNLMAVNASLQAEVHDNDLNTVTGTQADAAITNPATDGSIVSYMRGKLTQISAILAKYISTGAAVGVSDSVPALGSDGANYRHLLTDATGKLQVGIDSSALPTGAATEAKQDAAITQLTSIAGEDFATQTTLAAVDTKLATLNAKDFATDTELQSVDTRIETLNTNFGAQADAAAATDTGAASLVSLFKRSLQHLTSLIGKYITNGAAVGTLDSIPVMGSDGVNYRQLKVDANGVLNVYQNQESVRVFTQLDTSVDNITDAAYTELLSTVGATDITELKITCQFGVNLLLATGAAASEVDIAIIPKGGFADGSLKVAIPAGTRLSLKSADTGVTASAGKLILNGIG